MISGFFLYEEEADEDGYLMIVVGN